MNNLTTANSNTIVNNQTVIQETKPLTFKNYFQIGTAFLGFGYGCIGTTMAADTIAQKLLGKCPEDLVYDLINKNEYYICTNELKKASDFWLASLGLYTLATAITFGPMLLKRMAKKVDHYFDTMNKPVELRQETAELEPENKVIFTKVGNMAKNIFFLTTGLSAIYQSLNASYYYGNASYSYLFENCMSSQYVTYFYSNATQETKTELFEACQVNTSLGKVHLLAAAILLTLTAAPILVKSAKSFIIKSPDKPVETVNKA
jgi:hypothetical protein